MKTLIAIAVAGSLLVLSSPGFGAEHKQPGNSMHGDKMMHGGEGDMPEMCRDMMQTRKKMMSRMSEMDKAIEEKLAAARERTGEEKVVALTEVVEALVGQRQMMRKHTMSGMSGMMGHMMSHMQGSTMEGGKMEMCPMMKGTMMQGGMKGSEGQAGEMDHSAHH